MAASRRVLIANYRYFISSGPERYLFNIKSMLEGRGHTVMPFSVRYGQNEPSEYARYFVSPLAGEDEVFFDQHRKTPATVAKTLSRLFYSREVEQAVTRMAEETRPDVAYVLYYLRKMSPSLLVGLKKQGLPIVARISDYGMFCGEHHMLRDGRPCTLCLDEGLQNEVRHACVKGSRAISALDVAATTFHRAKGYFDLIDRFVTTNPFMSEMMIRGGIDPARIVCIPTFTDMARFHPDADGPASPPYMLYVGRLDEPKGVHVLIEAMAMLRDRFGGDLPELRIAGEGHTRTYVDGLHAQAARLGLEGRVRFLGGVAGDDIPLLFRGALFSLMPALWYENLPNSVVESLSSGCPVVASDIGSLAVTITDGVDGLHHRPGDAAHLAAQAARLIADPALRRRLAAGARETAERNHSPDRHVSLLEGVFDEVIGEAGAPAAKRAAIG
ncbi:glycosyltransferase family 4 protein [Sphingomonas solaris]|uniref:glycosyltransferase family 4 protein n=1 Tax=Alterirhizorhabdus solaris TaxID=2529389 RepID=UPI001396B4CD|nr:glycosyltransferase family 4 protein [Sphingomonas solaris]